MIVYYNGELLPKEDVRISPDDRGFLFADGVYEVICAYDGTLFMSDVHFKRLVRSLQALQIPLPDLGLLRASVEALLPQNALDHAGAKLYIQVTRGVAPRGHPFPERPVSPTVYASAESFVPPEALWANGVRAIMLPDLRWARCDIKSLMLLPNVLASQRAKQAGAYDAILVRDGVVTEGSHTSVCAIFDGQLVTHPLTHHILGSVTRDAVLTLCQELEIPYEERPILEETLCDADEVLLLGTTTGVMPVVEIEGRPIGEGKPGAITRNLQGALHGMMLGKHP